MANLILIKGNKDEYDKKQLEKRIFLENKYYDLYLDYNYGFSKDINLQKSLYYGIKYICIKQIDNLPYNKLLTLFKDIQNIHSLMSTTTYSQMINMFPIIKEYDGEKYCCKDYYSTQDYLKDKDLNDLIGLNNTDEFCSYYYNNNIINFTVKSFLIVDKLRKYRNESGLLESVLEQLDPEHTINVYTYDKENDIMINNNTHEIVKVKKKIPKYLKLVKKEG